MLKCRLAISCACLIVAGCRTPPLPSIDQSVNNYASRPYDVAPTAAVKPAAAAPPVDGAVPPDGATSSNDLPHGETQLTKLIPVPPADPANTGQAASAQSPITLVSAQVEQTPPARGPSGPPVGKFDLKIPAAVPGAETSQIKLPRERADRAQAIARLYPQLSPLTEEPVPQPSPSGHPFTLDELQRLAAANSPTLRQAASDVENAKGRLQQARTYANPTVGVGTSPNANNTGAATTGGFVDQVITTAGKMKLAAASAQVDVSNAELALKRARNDLATQVRSAYYNLVVAQETVRITRVVAHFTDEVYRLQTDLLAGGFAASHEPAALRSQVFVVRLAHKQAITNYAYAWKQLVAAIGLPQMPLSAVEGQVDRFIPYYEYDTVLAYVLRNHTDVLTARNNMAAAEYDLKLAQVVPIPDLDVQGQMWQENMILPRMQYHQMSVGIKLPIWDQNKGNIRAAAAARARASEGPHQAALALTSGLAAAYGAYQDNLAAVEYYRLYILPDQVRYYRGVFERRQIDPAFAFNDLVTAQQNLVADVTAYLGILGQLWTSVVNVADYLQTDDFYQLGKPLELPPLPEFEGPHCWPCPHPQPNGIVPLGGQTPVGGDAVDKPTEVSAAKAAAQAPNRAELGAAPAQQQPAIAPVSFVSPAVAAAPIMQRPASPPRPLGPVQLSTALSTPPGGSQTIGPSGTIPVETVLPLPR